MKTRIGNSRPKSDREVKIDMRDMRCSYSVLKTFSESSLLRSLPLAARSLWMELTVAMWEGGRNDLIFGPCRPDNSEIATLAGTTELEVNIHLEAIIKRRLLLRRDDGVLMSPLLSSLTNRSEINRRNALSGVAKRRSRVGKQADLLGDSLNKIKDIGQ